MYTVTFLTDYSKSKYCADYAFKTEEQALELCEVVFTTDTAIRVKKDGKEVHIRTSRIVEFTIQHNKG